MFGYFYMIGFVFTSACFPGLACLYRTLKRSAVWGNEMLDRRLKAKRKCSYFLTAWFLSCERSLKGPITQQSRAIRLEVVRNTVLHLKETRRSISAFSLAGIKKVSQPERRRFKVSHMKPAERFFFFSSSEHSKSTRNYILRNVALVQYVCEKGDYVFKRCERFA